ncbi:hypothetical protein MKLM6_0409 [Methylomonas koyamae]|nr:hypothetical protein MKLM6_0409 [Methylomonas koyamae]
MMKEKYSMRTTGCYRSEAKRYAVRTLVSYLSPWLATLALRQKELVRTLKVRPWHVD